MHTIVYNKRQHLNIDKFWKSKVLFEKSNAINFGNQKCHLRNQTRQILEIKNAFEKSNATKTFKIKIVIGGIKRDKFKIKMTQ